MFKTPLNNRTVRISLTRWEVLAICRLLTASIYQCPEANWMQTVHDKLREQIAAFDAKQEEGEHQ